MSDFVPPLERPEWNFFAEACKPVQPTDEQRQKFGQMVEATARQIETARFLPQLRDPFPAERVRQLFTSRAMPWGVRGKMDPIFAAGLYSLPP
jgi:hypothetical protein